MIAISLSESSEMIDVNMKHEDDNQYVKSLAEYQKMIELFLLNQNLTQALLQCDEG
jgi:hypothetical protein